MKPHLKEQIIHSHFHPQINEPVFYVEAKKPSKNLLNPDYYFQAIRYGWSSNTPLVVLTDFEEFHVIDSRYKPNIKNCLERNLQSYHYLEYLDKEKFKWIYYLFSREAVENNGIGNYVNELKKIKGKKIREGITGKYQNIDDSFLDELDIIRNELAKVFKKNNKELVSDELTEAVQRTIDRLVFLRFLEAKLIEPENHIKQYFRNLSNVIPAKAGIQKTNEGLAWQRFIKDCKTLDAKYNGIVFKNHPLLDSERFNPPENKSFETICERLIHENSPYDFNLIPIHILGSIYERFLGKVVHATAQQVRIEEKPEVRKAGGVYYTPQYIVKYIVDNTVGKIIEGLTPAQISKLKFGDIACGSGSFLITIFDILLKYHSRWYNSNPEQAKKDKCVNINESWLLTLEQKRKILINNIYGVDLDPQAVEVTQVSLFLKLLEDETPSSIHLSDMFLKDTILPDLSKNIKCGNSLIGTDILSNDGNLFPLNKGGTGDVIDEEKIKPMDFETAFPDIMKNGGFDAIVGNPPYINIQYIDNITKGYLREKYKVFAGKADILYFFFERVLNLLKKNSLMGFITSRYFVEATDAKPLRNYITKNAHVVELVDFKNYSVFKGIGIHTIISIITKDERTTTTINLLKNIINQSITDKSNFNIFDITLRSEEWVFTNRLEKKLFDKVNLSAVCLGELSTIEQGQKSGLNSVFGIEEIIAKQMEKEPLRKLIKNSHIKRYYADYKNLYLIYSDSNFDVNKYPKIKEYLLQHKKELMRRQAKDNLYPWYRLQRPRNKELFDAKEKIIVPYRAEYNKFAYDNVQYFNDGGDIRIIVLNKNKEYKTKFCIGILNSKLMNFYYEFIGRRKGKMLEYFVEPLAKIPIVKIDFSNTIQRAQHDKMVYFVNQMLESKKNQMESTTERDKSFWENKCSSLDKQIDSLVYELYGLTEEEIKIVENNN